MSRRAQTLRHNQTDAERRLWSCLRSRQLGGFKFRRQYPISPYVADFVCVETGLIIEIDGSQHVVDRSRDAERARFFERIGYRTVRYWDNDVLLRTSEVLEAILLELGSPHPHPLPRGEGALESF
ncbi:MAG: endonuclease domain-containing protein [Betaproteobacteria bacterium]|nr:endonuclease domain-containing protein [Betaproteobacteria bacterium]